MFPRRSLSVGLVGLAAIGSSCGRTDERVVVFAASSLTDVFDRLEGEFESDHPTIDVVVTTGGSSSLVAQLIDGAPADVLATADNDTMDRALTAIAAAGKPTDLAKNELVIAVERGNPLGIHELGDLADTPIVVVAAPEVPAGAYAATAMRCADIDVDPASYEQSVRAVATKVALGEADAGLVYRTDIDDRLEAIELPDDCRVLANYPLVAVSDSGIVQQFVAFVSGPAGDRALIDAGFELP